MAGKLQNELQKKNGFETLQQEAIISILFTNELFQHRFGQFFREYGINQAQYNILRILKGFGKPVPSREIVKRMIAVVPAITSSINHLEKNGFVVRERSEEDRRVYFITLTALGRKLLLKMAKPNLAMHSQLIGHMTEKQCRQLIDLLENARETLAK